MQLSHLDDHGKANMVNIGNKCITSRKAKASAFVRMNAEVLQNVIDNSFSKGDVISVARIAGIQAAKQTSGLIPLCHPLAIQAIDIKINPDKPGNGLCITSEVSIEGKTGVEMEALTAASITALTIYDMCKSMDKAIIIEKIQLESKSGGKSGDWRREDQ